MKYSDNFLATLKLSPKSFTVLAIVISFINYIGALFSISDGLQYNNWSRLVIGFAYLGAASTFSYVAFTSFITRMSFSCFVISANVNILVRAFQNFELGHIIDGRIWVGFLILVTVWASIMLAGLGKEQKKKT